MVESQVPGIIFSNAAIKVEELNSHLSQKLLSPQLNQLVSILPYTAELYLVGGVVRDCLLGKTAEDIDLCCSLDPLNLQKILHQAGLRTIDTGLEHGTLTILWNGDFKAEISSFRTPGIRQGFQLGSSIKQDLGGRDFTINALAFDLRNKSLIDPYDGVNDLQTHQLKCPGSAEERILEDPLRILRAVRFGPANGRKLDSELLNACSKHAKLLANIAVERVRVELEKILLSSFPRAAFVCLRQIGAIDVLLPEVVPTFDFEQNQFHHEDVFQHTLSVVERAPLEPLLKWSALMHDLGKPGTLSFGPTNRRHFYNHEDLSAVLADKIMQRLKFSERDRADIKLLVKLHMRPITCGAAGVRRLLRDLGPLFEDWLKLKRADRPPIFCDNLLEEHFANFNRLVEIERNRTVGSVFDPLAVDGNDLKELGLSPGKIMGEILRNLREQVIMKPELNQKQVLLDLAKQFLQKNYPNY